jgi:pyridoxal phosphate enzyme (YggS family)
LWFVLKDRLSGVEERIVGACGKAGRPREEVTLIAVTKMFPASTIADAYELGLRHFGENYVQEFGAKRAQLPELPGATFHLIGHLQSNKSKAAAELFQVIQTVDTPKLSRRLNDAVQKMDVMIEVRLSEEESKHGAMAEDLPGLVNAVRECPGLRLLGLMTVPPWSTDAELSRPYFRRLRELAEAHGLRALSMGMSNDFEVAIEEGATHIRVGTALFGSRRKT